uniref:ATP synthase subunit 8 n=1 Tax=Bothriocroton auruginans TaxID=188736 RepID=UPI0030FE1162
MPQLFPMNWMLISLTIILILFSILINTFFLKMNFNMNFKKYINKNNKSITFKW